MGTLLPVNIAYLYGQGHRPGSTFLQRPKWGDEQTGSMEDATLVMGVTVLAMYFRSVENRVWNPQLHVLTSISPLIESNREPQALKRVDLCE